LTGRRRALPEFGRVGVGARENRAAARGPGLRIHQEVGDSNHKPSPKGPTTIDA